MVNTTFNSDGNAVVHMHGVGRIGVSADSTVGDNGKPLYWQDLTFYSPEGAVIGTVIVFLNQPEAALPVGDQPPYWGMDPTRAPVVFDEGVPF